MRHAIDPKIDCVFKALLGAEHNRALLVHFLNAILGAELPAPIVAVDILNPYNEREFVSDKLSIVDVKARDGTGRLYQIEIQLLDFPDLRARILYTWADIYQAQLRRGDNYDSLEPVYSIWLLGETLLPERPGYAHDYRLRDAEGHVLFNHGGIWLLELSKFDAPEVETEEQRWLKFFKDGARLDGDALPEWMQTMEMQQAMSTLKHFSEQERAYHAYQARVTYLRDQRSLQRHLAQLRNAVEQEHAALEQERAAKERERTAKERALASEEQERAAKEEALAEIERLKAQLREGIPRNP
jgi:predicted transposase/invertase (TIGR01784 family)